MNPVDKTNPTKAHRARLCCLVMYMSGPTRNSYNTNLIPLTHCFQHVAKVRGIIDVP